MPVPLLNPPTLDSCTRLAAALRARGLMLACAESCTGGLIGAACTTLAGSSDWFDRGFITYSNAAKSEMLGVDPDLITRHGAVSEPVARAMAVGAVARSAARVSLAVTGIAGPGGGSADKPVGTVWFAWNIEGTLYSHVQRLDGDRAQVRDAAARHALGMLAQWMEEMR